MQLRAPSLPPLSARLGSSVRLGSPVRFGFSTRLGVALVGALLLVGCPTPPTPAEKASEAAHELNMSARWGRLDVAMSHSARKDQADFMKRHAEWHGKLRVVDTEMAGLTMTDTLHATVQVDVSWLYDDDTTLRVTRIEQKWSDAEGKWLMESEKRIGGSLGLFGEKIDRGDPKKDKHFPTRTIR